MTSNCVLCKTKFETTIWMKSTRNILEQQPHGISGKKVRTVGQRKMKTKAHLKICCQLFKTCSQYFLLHYFINKLQTEAYNEC